MVHLSLSIAASTPQQWRRRGCLHEEKSIWHVSYEVKRIYLMGIMHNRHTHGSQSEDAEQSWVPQSMRRGVPPSFLPYVRSRTALSSSHRWKGFWNVRWTPKVSATRRKSHGPVCPYPEMAMIGTAGSTSRSSWMTSSPLCAGSSMSRIITSMDAAWEHCTPSWPSQASTVS